MMEGVISWRVSEILVESSELKESDDSTSDVVVIISDLRSSKAATNGAVSLDGPL